MHQYVTNVYYLDTLTTHTLNDDVEIYSSAMSSKHLEAQKTSKGEQDSRMEA